MSLDFLRYAPFLTRDRAWRCALVFAVISLAMLRWDAALHVSAGITNDAGEHIARDFINYWSGARLAADGRAAIAYDTTAYHDYQRSLVGPASESKMYSYPPVAMLLTLPLAALGFVPALVLWLVLGPALCALLLVRRLGGSLAVLAAIGTPAAFLNALSGQNGQFTAALLAGGLMMCDRAPVLAGILFGMLSYEPQIALLLPLALIAGRRWLVLAAAAATVACLVAVSAWLFGIEAWAGFLRQTALQRLAMEYGDSFWHRTPTVFAALRLLGASLATSYALQAASAVLAAIATIIVWRRRGSLSLKSATLAVAIFLATPYAWDYDMVVLTFVAMWLAEDARRTGFLAWEKLAMALLLVMPLGFSIAKAYGLQLGPLVLWTMLALLVRRSLSLAPHRAVVAHQRAAAA